MSLKTIIFYEFEGVKAPLLEINRTSKEFYINKLITNDIKMLKGSHFSFHESGESGHKQNRKSTRHSLKDRGALKDYTDTEQIMNAFVFDHPAETKKKIRAHDMVIKTNMPFSFEVTISGTELADSFFENKEFVCVPPIEGSKPYTYVTFS